MWDAASDGPRGSRRRGLRPARFLALLPGLALATVALAGARARPLRLVAAGILSLALALALDQARSPSVPGANGDASGVAALLEIVRRLAAERPGRARGLLVVPD